MKSFFEGMQNFYYKPSITLLDDHVKRSILKMKSGSSNFSFVDLFSSLVHFECNRQQFRRNIRYTLTWKYGIQRWRWLPALWLGPLRCCGMSLEHVLKINDSKLKLLRIFDQFLTEVFINPPIKKTQNFFRKKKIQYLSRI